MKISIIDMALGLLSILSFALAFISEEYRLIASISAFVLLIFLVLSFQFLEISEIRNEQKKNSERLKIYERLSKLEAKMEILVNGQKR